MEWREINDRGELTVLFVFPAERKPDSGTWLWRLRWSDERGLDRAGRADELGHAVGEEVGGPNVARAIDRDVNRNLEIRIGKARAWRKRSTESIQL